MKRTLNFIIVALMLFLAIGAVGCAAEFELSSLDVSPEICFPGDSVAISATLANNGNAKGDYVAELLVNGVTEHLQNYTLEPGSSESLSFTLSRGELGKYEVQIGELKESFIVLGATNLTISPSQVLIDEPVTIAADLQNAAETQATYQCCLLCEGKELEAQGVTVAGTSTKKVTFTVSQANSGRYQVELLGLSGSYKVLKPAEFKIVNFDLAPNPAKVGEQVTGTATIENVGEATGTYKANLLVDGEVIWTTEVTLAGGTTEAVSFSEYTDHPGNFNIEIDGQKVTLRVVEPVRLETGTELKRKISGKGKFDVDNQLDSDVVVILSAIKEPETPLLAIYIQSHDSCKTSGIKEGTYLLYVAVGEAWDESSRKFLMDATYHRSNREFEWVETSRRYQTWYITLDPAVAALYYQDVSEDEFPSLE